MMWSRQTTPSNDTSDPHGPRVLAQVVPHLSTVFSCTINVESTEVFVQRAPTRTHQARGTFQDAGVGNVCNALTKEPADALDSTPNIEHLRNRDKLIWTLIVRASLAGEMDSAGAGKLPLGGIIDEAPMSHEFAPRLQPHMGKTTGHKTKRKQVPSDSEEDKKGRKRQRGSGKRNRSQKQTMTDPRRENPAAEGGGRTGLATGIPKGWRQERETKTLGNG